MAVGRARTGSDGCYYEITLKKGGWVCPMVGSRERGGSSELRKETCWGIRAKEMETGKTLERE